MSEAEGASEWSAPVRHSSVAVIRSGRWAGIAGRVRGCDHVFSGNQGGTGRRVGRVASLRHGVFVEPPSGFGLRFLYPGWRPLRGLTLGYSVCNAFGVEFREEGFWRYLLRWEALAGS